MLGLSFMGYYYYRQTKIAMNNVYSSSLISVKLINESNAIVQMICSVNLEYLLAPIGVQDINAVSQVTADQATTVSSAIEKFTASIDQINLSCQSLTALAQDLETGVSSFSI